MGFGLKHHAFRRAVGDDPAFPHDDQPPGMGQHLFQIVDTDDDGLAARMQGDELGQDSADPVIIEIGKGFVEHDNLRLHSQDPGNRQAAFFPAG